MQIFPTAVCNVTEMTSLETARSLAGGGGGGGVEGELLVSYLSLSKGGVCGRNLTAGKIIFIGRQTSSLYLVLWLCVCIYIYAPSI